MRIRCLFATNPQDVNGVHGFVSVGIEFNFGKAAFIIASNVDVLTLGTWQQRREYQKGRQTAEAEHCHHGRGEGLEETTTTANSERERERPEAFSFSGTEEK